MEKNVQIQWEEQLIFITEKYSLKEEDIIEFLGYQQLFFNNARGNDSKKLPPEVEEKLSELYYHPEKLLRIVTDYLDSFFEKENGESESWDASAQRILHLIGKTLPAVFNEIWYQFLGITSEINQMMEHKEMNFIEKKFEELVEKSILMMKCHEITWEYTVKWLEFIFSRKDLEDILGEKVVMTSKAFKYINNDINETLSGKGKEKYEKSLEDLKCIVKEIECMMQEINKVKKEDKDEK